jgi:hypothetical protein
LSKDELLLLVITITTSCQGTKSSLETVKPSIQPIDIKPTRPAFQVTNYPVYPPPIGSSYPIQIINNPPYPLTTLGVYPQPVPRLNLTLTPTINQKPVVTAEPTQPRATPIITPCLSSNNESALTLSALQNAEYRLDAWDLNDIIQLTDGVYHRPGMPAQDNYIKLKGPIAYGDLDGDGRGDAAVILRYWGGGTGVFVFLAAVVDQNGKPYNISTRTLGDRVQILSICVLSGTITLNMLIAGPNDGLCCPTQQIISTWKLIDKELVRTR